jgi:hypothetical protein
MNRKRVRANVTKEAVQQREVCDRIGADYEPPSAGSMTGIALHTRGLEPLNALRHPVEHGTCGWYIWWGDTLSEEPDFFDPLHVEHLPEECPEIVPYLALPPGWRVQLAPGYEDAWFDPNLLDTDAKVDVEE